MCSEDLIGVSSPLVSCPSGKIDVFAPQDQIRLGPRNFITQKFCIIFCLRIGESRVGHGGKLISKISRERCSNFVKHAIGVCISIVGRAALLVSFKNVSRSRDDRRGKHVALFA